jgi:integrase
MLHGLFGSAQFEDEYNKALLGTELAASSPAAIGASRSKPGSVNEVIAKYLQSDRFLNGLSITTQKQRRPALDRLREQYGAKPFALMHREFIENTLASLKAHAARELFKTLRGLMTFALQEKFCKTDPMMGLRTPKLPKSDGHATWPEDQIEQFRSHFPLGSMERLALELALNTGQRVSDLARMGRQHVRDNILRIKQKKTGVTVAIPLHTDLLAAIAAMPPSDLTFLTDRRGRPFGAHNLSLWFSQSARAAGLPEGYTAHGLRKSCCTRLAEAGATTNEIAGVSGHQTLGEVARYTRDQDRVKAAGSAMAKLMASRG